MRSVMLFVFIACWSYSVSAATTIAVNLYEVKTSSSVNGLMLRHHPSAARINPSGCTRNDFYVLLKTNSRYDEIRELVQSTLSQAGNHRNNIQFELTSSCSQGYPVIGNISIQRSV